MNDITVQMKAMQMSACTAMNHPKKGKIFFRQEQKNSLNNISLQNETAMHTPEVAA